MSVKEMDVTTTITNLWFVISLVCIHQYSATVLTSQAFSRGDFPSLPGFVFGSGSSAYQYEGAALEDGRTPSIWDTYARAGGATTTRGDTACDGYHRYKEDVQLMVDTGLEAYRFSISWPRLIPNGRGPVNPKALEYYNSLINELIRHGIEPHVTLLHYDVPQALEDEYEGWLSRKMVKDFTAYADVCFREFGDRVRHWTTVNEANVFILSGYDLGNLPPGRCSFPYGNCSVGNSSVEPYIVAHHILLAHASVSRLYKTKYQVRQLGFIGINLLFLWTIPYTNATEDVIAAKRSNDFLVGWFLDPLMFGDYPVIMKTNAGSRIPDFSEEESHLIKGSADFIGMNHYFTVHVQDKSSSLRVAERDYIGDMAVKIIYGPPDQFPINPSGLFDLLEYFKHFYGNIPIYIHENGQVTRRNATLNDIPRVKYLEAYIGGVLDAIKNGSNVRGYFCWSFMDLVELLDEETSYGLYYVDLDSKDLRRYPKLSALWYTDFLKGFGSLMMSLENKRRNWNKSMVL